MFDYLRYYDILNVAYRNETMNRNYQRVIVFCFGQCPNIKESIALQCIELRFLSVLAAINVIKSLLPPKAVQKIQMLKKASILTFVPEDQALKCWGGKDDYVFSFVPETREQTKEDSVVQTPSNKKVLLV